MGECTINDEPGSDDEFEDILFEEDYNVLHQSPDSFIDTEERHTPSPTTLRLPISIATPPPPIHSTPTNTQSSIVQTPTTSILPIHSNPMNTQPAQVQTPSTITQQPSQVHMPPNTHQIPTTWSKILHSVPIHPFTGSVGPTFTVTECRILSFFHC